MLNILENFDLKKHGRWSPETLHLMIEAMRRAYCDRARHLGDPDFVKIPDHLTTKEYAKKLAAGIDLDEGDAERRRSPPEIALDERERQHHALLRHRQGRHGGQQHLHAGEQLRLAVVVRGAGFLLNNEMTDFNPRPGVTTRSGHDRHRSRT